MELLLSGITSTLELAEKALEGVPVPGAKAAIGSILLIIKQVDVRLSSMIIQLERWLTIHYHRQVKRIEKS